MQYFSNFAAHETHLGKFGFYYVNILMARHCQLQLLQQQVSIIQFKFKNPGLLQIEENPRAPKMTPGYLLALCISLCSFCLQAQFLSLHYAQHREGASLLMPTKVSLLSHFSFAEPGSVASFDWPELYHVSTHVMKDIKSIPFKQHC